MAKAKARTMAQMKREMSKAGENYGRLSSRDIAKKYKKSKKTKFEERSR
jgi:hypothetical protein